MGFSPIEKHIAYTPVVDLLSPLVTSSPKIHQLLLTGNPTFNPLFSLLPNLLFYNTL